MEIIRVLLAEDNPGDQRLLQEFLRESKNQEIKLSTVESLGEATERLQSAQFDLILLDLSLSDSQGLNTFRKIHVAHPSLPIVVLTGLDDQATAIQALREGAQDYLIKGEVEGNLLNRAIQYAIERKKTHAELEHLFNQVQKNRDDLLSILNELHIGTVLTDESGMVVFASVLAQRILGKTLEEMEGQSWNRGIGFNKHDINQLQKMLDQEPKDRTKVSISLVMPKHSRKWIDIDIKNDPRDPRASMFFLYDVTEIVDLRRLLDEQSSFHDLIGKSQPMQEVYKRIRTLAEVDSTVLIEGETGTGKELVARAIHFASPRKAEPFLAVNCAGLTESLLGSQLFGHKRGAFTGAATDHQGFFEAAHGGSIFLDEIGDMPMSVQTSLLRVLQEKEITRVGESQPRKVDVRIITATHRHLNDQVSEGVFRADLLYRIRVGRISIPPLRERQEDIPLMVAAFLSQCRKSMGKFHVQEISSDALKLLSQYPWPGNVRELKSSIEFSVLQCSDPIIHSKELPPEILQTAEFSKGTSSARRIPNQSGTGEKDKVQILNALEQSKGNRTAAAKLMGVSRATFYRWLEDLGISSSA
jgi:PAS domain S-box-containing protein